ncbi:spermatogenesis- and oogenesis-specific basic helix-loop-helix-containing protein 1 [Ursus arctos]|uniref:spermatogenesis- and oogenesis-specific basic helix-loop-helix-containing protein 1 n=1 Tax=Ursus arctos TaxID=9644 RepID=UPI0020171019|nr:spermatogenesis- and oogenesis-specific basic helix-loop-helix-containing protein 1 [Ursus arctos]
MASQGPEAAVEGCSGSFPSSTQGCSEDHGQGARPVKAPSERSGFGFGLPRNVLSERERRKRISVSCERLRALLPQFDGRREDMASVLEMAVQFLRLAGTVVPNQEPHAPPSPLVSEEAQSCLDQAGPPAEEASSVETPDIRPVSGCDVEDGTSFLLNTSPDWWLGSLEGRGAGAPSRSTARSSLLDRAEPGFLTDPEPGSQELPDGPLEPWGSDTGCPSLALREEVDSIFPDFFPC